MNFCDKCHNLLIKSTDGSLTMVCTAGCSKPIPAPPKSRLLFSEDTGVEDSIEKYSKFLEVAAYLPTVLKVKKSCPKCDNAIVTMVRVTKKEKVIHLCECGYKWNY